MKSNTITLLSGTALAIVAGIANAEGPMALNAEQMDQVTAGRGFNSLTEVRKLVDIRETINEQKLAFFQVVTQVVGYSAVAEAEADSENQFGVDAQTFTFAEVYPVSDTTGALNGFWKASSLSKSIALASPQQTTTP